MIERLPQYRAPFQLANVWPAAVPLLCLAGRGRYGVLATAGVEIKADEALSQPLSYKAGKGNTPLPFLSGIIGVLSYDEAQPSRYFRVYDALLFDLEARELFWSRADSKPEKLDFRLSAAALAQLLQQASEGFLDVPVAGVTLIPKETDESYRRKVTQALRDIRNGRYYQINLLRYFGLTYSPERSQLLRLLQDRGGPHAAYVEIPGLRLASFSPERFIELERSPSEEESGALSLRAIACPIKGTAARLSGSLSGSAEDQAIGQRLLENDKDLAELHMIVDLMRNDLNRVSQSGTVKVVHANRLVTHPTVHHLEARIESQLQDNLTLGAFLQAVCPGGSITGAPKLEVMGAIREYEGRGRGYFMGNIFYLDDRGRFDSSILIRTLVRNEHGSDEFAAGSGLVIKSDPEHERQEIETKCRVIL